ncbi:MAG: cph1 4 [Mucilaginibacter sp.]|nr:cph1 4 [Mucilaginibacter sp.]
MSRKPRGIASRYILLIGIIVMSKLIKLRKSDSTSDNNSSGGHNVVNLLFRKLIENSYEGVTLLDKDLQIIYRSNSAERINGLNTADRLKYNTTALIHPDDVERVKLLLDEVLVNPGLTKTCTFRSKHGDGHFIWLECVYTNMLDEHGVNAIVCNFRDISEKIHADELLQLTMQELFAYKYALDESSIVAITDQKGIIRHVNENFCRISKYTASELIGQDHRIINSGYHDKAFIRNLWVTISKGDTWKGEIKNKAKDGTYYWVDTTIVPFLNEKGKPYQYVAIRADITERKLNQEKIIESESFIKTITDNLPAMIAYWNADLQCLFANKPYMEWFEKNPTEILGINKRNLLDKEEFEMHAAHIQNVLNGKPESFERAFYKSNGAKIFTHTQYLPDKQDSVIKGFYSLVYDVTEIKLAEIEVKKKTEQIENILESITDGFVAIDRDTRYTYGNKRIEEIFGVPVSAILGKTLLEVYPGATETETYKSIKKALQEKIYVCNDDYYAPYNLWLENRIYPSGSGVSMFIRDITERKNEELQKSLLSEISLIFNETFELKDTLQKVLERLVYFGNFGMAEAWLIGIDKNIIQLTASFPKTTELQVFYDESKEIKSFVKGQGLPGIAWETQKVQFWRDVDKNEQFVRRTAAKKVGLKTVCGIPLQHNKEVIGVLLLGSTRDEKQETDFNKLVGSLSDYLGTEIKRKQLEQELKQVFDFAPDILCIANIDGYFKKVNPAMSVLLEYNEEELLSRPFMEFVHPLDKEKTVSELQNIITGKPTYYIENRYITKSGKIKWLAWTTTGASEQGILYCSAKDITDKKELTELLNKAITLARIGAWEVDLVKGIVHWSDITREIHETEPGFEPNIEEASNFYKEGENRETIIKIMEAAAIRGTRADVELQIITAKGRAKWVRIIVEAEFTDGKCERLYGSFQDIDDRKRAEISGKQALEERNTILESIDDAFFAVDKNWVVTYWNNMAENVLKTPRDKTLNHNLWEIFSESIDSNSYKKYHQALKTNQAVHFEDYYPPLHKWYEISAYPSDNGLSVYFKDVTDRKLSDTLLRELNVKLQKHARELAISNAELEQFAYVASHDLQEPLRMVTSFMSQLEKKYGDVVDEKGRQYIHFAVDGAKRMRQIILDLLEFSRVGRTEDDLEDVNFNKVVNEILVLYRRQIEEVQASIEFENLPIIKTYKTPVRQVFQNLVSNSLKYHSADRAPVISISCKETGTQFQFTIKDNGIGIAPEYFDKIFIIFQRLHNKDEYSGTGMGLAIAKKIIENMGGKIWVKSEEGKGSTFYFTMLKK